MPDLTDPNTLCVCGHKRRDHNISEPGFAYDRGLSEGACLHRGGESGFPGGFSDGCIEFKPADPASEPEPEPAELAFVQGGRVIRECTPQDLIGLIGYEVQNADNPREAASAWLTSVTEAVSAAIKIAEGEDHGS